MKIIDLLVKISQGERMPKKIKYEGYVWEYDKVAKDYYRNDVDEEYIYLFQDLFKKETGFFINNEVKIIEEDKEFEDIREIRGEVERDKTLSHDENQDSIVKNFNMLIKWVNLLVRNQKRIINEINKLKGEK